MGRKRKTDPKVQGQANVIMNFKQSPLKLASFNKRDVRTQFAALCYRMQRDQVQVLLITSRNSRRWVLPKGWPIEGETPASSALIEAFEEAGVKGKALNVCVGLYSYTKSIGDEDDLPCAVSVFPVLVKKLVDDFPEAKDRKRKWFTLKKAASMVREPELQKILKHFDPTLLER